MACNKKKALKIFFCIGLSTFVIACTRIREVEDYAIQQSKANVALGEKLLTKENARQCLSKYAERKKDPEKWKFEKKLEANDLSTKFAIQVLTHKKKKNESKNLVVFRAVVSGGGRYVSGKKNILCYYDICNNNLNLLEVCDIKDKCSYYTYFDRWNF